MSKPGLFVLVALLAAGCSAKPPPAGAPAATAASDSEFEWTRAALARNPALEVLAVDAAERRIRVRERSSGTERSVGVDEVEAMPLAAPPPAPATAMTPPPTAPAASPSPTMAAPMTASAAAAATAGTEAPGAPRYSIERNSSGVTISGPGVEITSHTGDDGAGAAGAGADRGRAALGPAAANEGTPRIAEPLRCQGERFLRLDSQRLVFAGDGIIVERGCELYLTNSRIEALGAALVADASRVHLSNSTLIGGTSSLRLQNGAEVYVAGSTLRGISRRFDTSELHDLGGNRWD
jgi:hypothetical protein